MTAGRCNESCLTDTCTCSAVDAEHDRLTRMHRYDALVTDPPSVLTLKRAEHALSKITPEWRRRALADARDEENV